MLHLGNLFSFLFPDSSVLSNQNRGIKPHWLIWGCLGNETQLTWVWSSLLVLRGANLLPSVHSDSLGSQARTKTQHGVPITHCASSPTGTLDRTSKQLGPVTTGRLFLSGATQSQERSQNVHQEAQKWLESLVYRLKGADLYPKCTSFSWPWGLRHLLLLSWQSTSGASLISSLPFCSQGKIVRRQDHCLHYLP